MREPLLIRLPIFTSAFTNWLTGAFDYLSLKSRMNGAPYIKQCKGYCVLQKSFDLRRKGRIVTHPLMMIISHGIRKVQ